VSRPRRLRVVYVVPDLGVGGAERHVTTVMPRLDRSRFDPMVLCIGRRGELFSDLEAAGVPAVALGRTRREAFAALVDLVREFRRFRPDVVIVRGYNAELLGRVAAALAGVHHVVVWVHNCGDIQPRPVLRQLADHLLDPVTDAYFGVARTQVPYLEDVLGHPASKVRIIHNGVDPAPFSGGGDAGLREELGLEEDALVVGILAALRPEKDHETFLRAAQLVAAEVPRARFVVAGGGDRREALEALAERLGIADRVLFTGVRDAPALLRTIDVFVLSSYTIECFPMALLEAMASSRAAVCTAVGGVPELLEDGVTGYLVPPKDPRALAGRLTDLLTSAGTRAEFGAAARARVDSAFNLRRSVLETEQALLDVATPRPGRRPGGPVRLAVVMDETFVGGVEMLTLSLFRAFDPEVVQPRLLCLRKAGPLAADFERSGFDVEVLGRTGRFDPHTLPKLVRSLRRGRTDAVLVAHHHRASLALGRLAGRLARVPVDLVAAHDMDLTPVGKRCLPRWAVATLCASSALVLLTPGQGDYLRREEGVGRHRWSRTREVVIPNGIVVPPLPDMAAKNAARAALGLPEGAFVVGIVARLSAQKAHHVLLEAFASLGRSHPHARLVVVGGGERHDELLELAARLGIGDRVHFTGVRPDVPALLPAFDVACLSSVHEGVPIFAIEAMAAGLPMVATDCGGLRELVVDAEQGFIVPVGDATALAESLAVLADDPGLRGRQGAAARQAVEVRHNIEKTARAYEALFADLLGDR